MEFEKYTDRAKGFLQSAQTMALRRGHQRLTPEHLLKVLLEDSEGLCANLIRAAGGDPKTALEAVDAELDRFPKVEGSGAGQVYMSPELAHRLSSRPIGAGEGQRQADDEAGDAMGVDQRRKARHILAKAATPDRLERIGDDPAGVRQGEADRLGSDVEAHQPRPRRRRVAQFQRTA